VFTRDNGTIGVIGAHVDDFLIAGDEQNETWKRNIENVKASFRWTPWEEGKFKQCGVTVIQNADGSITQHQEEYLQGIQDISVSKDRQKQLTSPVTPSEKTELQGLLGALQWLTSQTRIDGRIDVNLLQTEVATATVETLLSANKVLRRIRANGALTLEIKKVHGTVHFVTWSDASWANRKDMTSTGGFLTGCCGDDVVSGQ
jgi:hypothetical protein